jgi:hypothetical protein
MFNLLKREGGKIMEIRQISYENENKGKKGWSNRDNFTCMKYSLKYEDDKNFIDKIIIEAKELLTSLGQDDSKLREAVLLLLSQRMSLIFYEDIFGDRISFRTETPKSLYSSEIRSLSGEVFEVKPSFVFGFPNVPLFKLNNSPNFEGHGSYNISCPKVKGIRGYNYKNLYTLVMVPSEKETFLDDIKKEVSFYVSGTATKEKVEECGGFTSYKTQGIESKTYNTSYKVVPVHKSLDVEEVFEMFLE